MPAIAGSKGCTWVFSRPGRLDDTAPVCSWLTGAFCASSSAALDSGSGQVLVNKPAAADTPRRLGSTERLCVGIVTGSLRCAGLTHLGQR